MLFLEIITHSILSSYWNITNVYSLTSSKMSSSWDGSKVHSGFKMISCILFISLSSLPSINASANIVLIIADDLDSTLDGMTPLNMTRNLIGNQGVTFPNCFVAAPICCPNRASILTGRYVHNHLTVNNSVEGNCNSISWQNTSETKTFAAYLNTLMGYETFYAGKYLNQYGHSNVGGPEHIPFGWNHWYGLVGNSKYYDYSLSINGKEQKFGHSVEEYLTDVITEYGTNFIKSQDKDQPFLMVLAPPAPHAPFIPAARHNDYYKGTTAKRTKNFNSSPQDKHWLVRRGPAPLSDNILLKLDEVYRRRWETLLAVDELVNSIIQTLQQMNFLENTFIIFTSDNGYHIGQFSLTIDKRQPYETDIRVPLLIRGPGIAPGTINKKPVSSVDIFSTILGISGLEKPSDGESVLLKLASDRTMLVEYRGENGLDDTKDGCSTDFDPNLKLCEPDWACKCMDGVNNTYNCIRRVSAGNNNLFCLFEDDEAFIEAYNLNLDEDEMTNIGYTMDSHLRHRFRNRLKKLLNCRNSNCIFNGPS